MGYPTWEGASTLIGGGAHTVENPKNQESFQNIAHKKNALGFHKDPPRSPSLHLDPWVQRSFLFKIFQVIYS